MNTDIFQQKKQNYMNKPSSLDIWLNYVRYRVNHLNRNYTIVVCGETGAGKSWLGLKLISIFSKHPSIENVFFNQKDVMQFLENDTNIQDCFMWDEASISGDGASKLSYHKNMQIVSAFELMRFRRHITILSTPSLSFLSTGIINLTHLYLEVKKVDKKKGLSYVMPRILQHNPLNGRIYKKKPRFRYGHKIYKLNEMVFTKAPDNLTIPYEKIQTKFKTQKMKEYREQVLKREAQEAIEWGKPKDITDIIKAVIAHKNDYINQKKKLNPELISADYDIGISTARKVKAVAERELNI